ncbi:hypothetical protein BDV28DRAFT_163764 [Aspergillus coremiiformis]|uniref:Peptide hydrolase n=1 Tax=Aspergillus coremiiformis TaxID=138285 RepID=A0A5N6ZIZ3_9EURO|nr:hypothetical protein BDV28DRAFT_163764 [Aspergillus coremiiformis]
MPFLRKGRLALWFLVLSANAYRNLSDTTLQTLSRPGTDFNIHNGSILAPLLQPRVPGTLGSEAVRRHIVQFFNSTLPEWKIELQTSTSRTPISEDQPVPFVNIIAYRDPPGANPTDIRRLTLVAHYDSLKEPEGFIGAIDSAAPCAIIMHAVRSIDAALTRQWNHTQCDSKYGLQVIFTDGEETFGNTLLANDGLYGSRSLAANWAVDKYPLSSTYESRLLSISLFVLLDLLGSKNPHIASYYPVTHRDYRRLAILESRLRGLGQLKSGGMEGISWFVDRAVDARNITRRSIEDDQVPFSALGVDILHLIDVDPVTGEFPKVWHTLDDDGGHLDMDTVEDWGVLITAFLAEWLELDGYME